MSRAFYLFTLSAAGGNIGWKLLVYRCFPRRGFPRTNWVVYKSRAVPEPHRVIAAFSIPIYSWKIDQCQHEPDSLGRALAPERHFPKSRYGFIAPKEDCLGISHDFHGVICDTTQELMPLVLSHYVGMGIALFGPLLSRK